MNLQEQANKYAEEKTNQVIEKAISEAYIEGYQAGYKDCEEEIPMKPQDNRSKYVDLGLPSGTLWSDDYENDSNEKRLSLPYKDAAQIKLPTAEQVNELFERCRWESDAKGSYSSLVPMTYAQCIGPNGKRIRFNATGYSDAIYVKEPNNVYFWISSEDESDDSYSARISSGFKPGGGPDTTTYNGIDELFKGFHLPVRLVK